MESRGPSFVDSTKLHEIKLELLNIMRANIQLGNATKEFKDSVHNAHRLVVEAQMILDRTLIDMATGDK